MQALPPYRNTVRRDCDGERGETKLKGVGLGGYKEKDDFVTSDE
jgi:hypothetical protein